MNELIYRWTCNNVKSISYTFNPIVKTIFSSVINLSCLCFLIPFSPLAFIMFTGKAWPAGQDA